MATVTADHELLFGLLALQNGLINQAQLVAAFQAWTLERSKSLADHLVVLGHLSPARRPVVEAMAALHLEAHGGDVGKSLAAVPASRATCAGLALIKEPQIEATLARVVNGQATVAENGDDPDRTAGLSLGAATSDGQRFRILRPHARGGLGEVFVALDAELHREVALKQILEKNADDPDSRQRFVAEAEITGGLEHPGVVPVYGLGTYDGGRPYYAMRFIKGESLKQAIEKFHSGDTVNNNAGRRSLELRKLLRRFLDVCNAVDYAHSRGVIHRDIKPANIILGKHGETLVVDWGLAKAVGHAEPGADERTLVPSSASGSSETLPGSALGTPAYMSPEQASGELDRLGPRSDVYSLGATLYSLLTGKPPLEGDEVGEALRKVQSGEFAAPRQIDASLDRALEAVCLKSMATAPKDRYATAHALAEDIERWMADEPVRAFREPILTRLARWGRLHKTGVAAAVALLATAVVALAAGAIVLQQANARTQRERDLAQYHFRNARTAVDEYLTRVGKNPLLKEHGLDDLRRELLEAALSYYRDFLRQPTTNPGVRAEAASAYEHVGDIQRELGHFEEALAAYDKGLALADQPHQAVARLRMEASRIATLSPLGRYDKGIAAFERAVAPFRNGRPVAAEFQPVLVKLYNAAVEVYGRVGRSDKAIDVSQEARRVGEAYVHDYPEDRDAFLELLLADSHMTRYLLLAGREEDAMRSGQRALERGEAYISSFPRDVDIRVTMSGVAVNLSNIENLRHHPDRAMNYSRRGVALLEDVCRDSPLLFEPVLTLSDQLGFLSNLECNSGLFPEARRSAERSIVLAEEILARSPSLPRANENLGVCRLALGRVLIRLREPAQALANLKKARDLLEHSGEAGYLYNAACDFLAGEFHRGDNRIWLASRT